ncbi:MAG: hypothetical protein WEC34_01550, partial [Acidimicrobiia bacterium]
TAQVAGATATRELAFTGAADGWLATGGTVAAALGAVLVLRARRRDAIRHLDVGGVDAGTVDA